MPAMTDSPTLNAGTPFLCADGETSLEGALFMPATGTHPTGTPPRAAVLLVHEFMGPGEYMHRHARRLSALGFVVLACDMYGAGVRPANPEEGSRVSRIYRGDRERMRRRLRASFDALRSHPATQGLPVFSLGFSFGGCAVLELARSGAPVDATCSVYGYLSTTHPLPPVEEKAVPCGPLLVLHGAHDRIVPLEDVAPFAQEMRDAQTDCRIILYSDAGHGFCNELLIPDEPLKSWYCPRLAHRAWKDILGFFDTVLATAEGTAFARESVSTQESASA